MKQYNVEIFDKNMEFVANSVTDSLKYKSDYLDPEKNSLELIDINTNIDIGSYLRIMREGEEYIGIITKTEAKKEGILNLTVEELPSLFDIDILIDVNDWNYTFEQYIKKWIEAVYVNGDTSMKIPFNITISSQTSDWSIEYDIENEPKEDEETPPVEVAYVNLFDDIILPAFTAHQIRIDVSVDLNGKKINLDIGKNTSEEIVIESDLPNIIDKTVTIKKSTQNTNKLIVYNQENFNELITYYLHPDDTYDTSDSNRITPVFYKLTDAKKETDKDDSGAEIITKTFAEAAREKAVETFGRNRYSNLIELEVLSDDELIAPANLKVGQIVSVISDGIAYNSILSGREINETTTLIFGNIRLELTKKLKGRG